MIVMKLIAVLRGLPLLAYLGVAWAANIIFWWLTRYFWLRPSLL